MPLSHYWLERRSEIKPALQTLKDKEEELEVTDQSQTPPPPRFPTAWTVRKADVETVSAFQEQERRRYTNPHKAFTYRCNGYESVVGPVKGKVPALPLFSKYVIGNIRTRNFFGCIGSY